MPFLIIFVFIPLIELGIFAAVSDKIGLWTTLLCALLTAIIGGNIVRMQGMHTIAAMQGSMNKGQIPTSEIFDGFCLVAAGALLITPGFLTDTIGFALLIPVIREWMRGFVKEHTNLGVDGAGFAHYRSDNDPTIIEGEYEDLDDTQHRDDDTTRLS